LRLPVFQLKIPNDIKGQAIREKIEGFLVRFEILDIGADIEPIGPEDDELASAAPGELHFRNDLLIDLEAGSAGDSIEIDPVLEIQSKHSRVRGELRGRLGVFGSFELEFVFESLVIDIVFKKCGAQRAPSGWRCEDARSLQGRLSGISDEHGS